MKKQYMNPSSITIEIKDFEIQMIATSENKTTGNQIDVDKKEAWDSDYDLAKTMNFKEDIQDW